MNNPNYTSVDFSTDTPANFLFAVKSHFSECSLTCAITAVSTDIQIQKGLSCVNLVSPVKSSGDQLLQNTVSSTNIMAFKTKCLLSKWADLSNTIFPYFPIKYIIFSMYIHLFTFTFMHLADAFSQSDFYSGYTCFFLYVCSLGIEPTTFALLTQCSNHWATGTHIY